VPYFTSITECVNELGKQLDAEPRSKLSRTGHNWATNDTNVNLIDHLYPRVDGAKMWINAGFLDPAYAEPGYSQTYLDQDTDDVWWIWTTCRRLFDLPEP